MSIEHRYHKTGLYIEVRAPVWVVRIARCRALVSIHKMSSRKSQEKFFTTSQAHWKADLSL